MQSSAQAFSQGYSSNPMQLLTINKSATNPFQLLKARSNALPVLQKAVDEDKDVNARLSEITMSLKTILQTLHPLTDIDDIKELSNYIKDLQTIQSGNNTALKNALLNDLHEESQKQMGVTPTEIVSEIPDNKVVQPVLDGGVIAGIVIGSAIGVAALGYGIFRCVKRICSAPTRQQEEMRDIELGEEEIVDIETPLLNQNARNIFIDQGESDLAQAGDKVQNIGTTVCGLVIGFGTKGIAVYHWPFMSINSTYADQLKAILVRAGSISHIEVISNDPHNKKSLEKNIETIRYIAGITGKNTTYYIHTELKDQDPFGTLNSNSFSSFHPTKQIDT